MFFWNKSKNESLNVSPNSENIESYFQQYFEIMDGVGEAKKQAELIKDKIKEYCNNSDSWKGNTSTFGAFKIRKVRARKYSYPSDILQNISKEFIKTVLDEKKLLESLESNDKKLEGLDIKINFSETLRIEKS